MWFGGIRFDTENGRYRFALFIALIVFAVGFCFGVAFATPKKQHKTMEELWQQTLEETHYEEHLLMGRPKPRTSGICRYEIQIEGKR